MACALGERKFIRCHAIFVIHQAGCGRRGVWLVKAIFIEDVIEYQV
jgi:hypothetical protein